MRALLALALLTIVLAGCGTPAPEPSFVVPPQDDEGRYVIQMTANLRFVPDRAEVPVGSTVLFRHTGGAHNVESVEGKWPASQVARDFELRATEDLVGDNRFFCRPHASAPYTSGMVGVLRVVAT